MTNKEMLKPIDKEKAKEQWNSLMKHRTKIRQLAKKYPTDIYNAKLEIYKLFFQKNKEIPKIIVAYLQGRLVEV